MPRRRVHPILNCPACDGIALVRKVRGVVYTDCWICGRHRWRAVLKKSPPAIYYVTRARAAPAEP